MTPLPILRRCGGARGRKLRPLGGAWPGLVFGLAVAVLPRPAAAVNALVIHRIQVNGQTLIVRSNAPVELGAFPQSVVIDVGEAAGGGGPSLRLSTRLEGFESSWHEAASVMALTVRFYNNSGDQISQNVYEVGGESTGWTGSLRTSSLTHRRETLVVPALATRLLVVISSAGPPTSVGIYVVANLVVRKSPGVGGGAILLQSPFDNDRGDRAGEDPPVGWMHDGTRPSIAHIVSFGQDPQTKAFAVVDEDKTSHGEWHNILESAPAVKPGDSLVVEWNEMYSIGSGAAHEVTYGGLNSGHYRFQARGLDVMGQLTGAGASVEMVVPPPFWQAPWFWGVVLAAVTAMVAGLSRYFVWHRMRREMARLQQQRALEQERLRIAHDIHDDLGARITQISLLSAMSQENPAFPDRARADFDKVSQMSRELVSALYETVWAVNPENDNMEALGNYLCQMVKQLCERTSLRCRFHVQDLPVEVRVSSQTRHNITMAVKEAVHNILKHARAAEVTLRMKLTGSLLEVSVQDDGAGFQGTGPAGGNGLSNMSQRLRNLGGECVVESQPGRGTTVRLRLILRPASAVG